ncbi:MAG: amidase [Alphaproteobacteria bacterium]|nr:MAG: amidase [Alphaproteobacteria bacterium]
MSGFSEYSNYDGLALGELVNKGDVKPEELLDEAIARVDAVNPQINAITTKMYDLAREQIKKGLPEGPFKGVPYPIKDLALHIPGTVLTNGSRAYADYVSDHESILVSRYKSAGLVLFGKTNTPEFGLVTTTEPQLFGPCRNPWNLDHSTGGSSGGAGAAVAARICPMANASDGGGSIRIPASSNGVFGFKPTRARTPLAPDKFDSWNGFSISHAVTLSVRDNAALLDATDGPALGDMYQAPRKDRPFLDEVGRDPGNLKIAFSAVSASGTPVDPECVKAAEMAAELCAELGHDVEEARPTYDAASLMRSMLSFMAADIAWSFTLREEQLGRALEDDEIETITRRYVEMGRGQSLFEYTRAKYDFQRGVRDIAPFFEKYDVFIQPVLGTPPPKLGHIDMMSEDMTTFGERVGIHSPFTALYNMTGQPSMSVPLHWSKEGLPVGTMFTAKYGNDALLFRLAAQLEKARPWIGKTPPVCA